MDPYDDFSNETINNYNFKWEGPSSQTKLLHGKIKRFINSCLTMVKSKKNKTLAKEGTLIMRGIFSNPAEQKFIDSY